MHLSSAPAWSFASLGHGSNNRSIFASDSSPGPGTYNFRSSFLSTVGAKIGKSERSQINGRGSSPGPGAYNLASRAVEGPKYTFQSKAMGRSANNSPGPGSYNQNFNDFTVKERSPTFRIGTSSRGDRSSPLNIPGPGCYTLSYKDSGPKWGFGTQSRSNAFRVEVPGPGAYKLPDSFEKKSGFTMPGRRPQSARINYPGPGSYSTIDRNMSPAYSISKAGRQGFSISSKATPGPGSYSPIRGSYKPSYIFGHAERPPLIRNINTPGPGQYSANRFSNSPAYSIRPKTAVNKFDNFPGPGHYDAHASIGDIKWSIGNQKRTGIYDSYKSASVIGPGHYYKGKESDGPKWSFTKSVRNDKKNNNAPGPGAYEIFSSISNLPSYAVRGYRKV
ncbi:hypothetical protein SteCoe_11821 [Stentor coeruleus]|uniref:Uncharacterized protein n=1 Tax=Stentor coeruleus TaxID=5963 RepID=A0A1R2CC73_9CILI|nr:hypothetical protein SteCoe_11821 [Stentor coeruleus]